MKQGGEGDVQLRDEAVFKRAEQQLAEHKVLAHTIVVAGALQERVNALQELGEVTLATATLPSYTFASA